MRPRRVEIEVGAVVVPHGMRAARDDLAAALARELGRLATAGIDAQPAAVPVARRRAERGGPATADAIGRAAARGVGEVISR